MADDPNTRPTKRHRFDSDGQSASSGGPAASGTEPTSGSPLAFEGLCIVVQHLQEELRSTVRKSDAPGYMVELLGVKNPVFFSRFADVHAFLKDARSFLGQLATLEFPWKLEEILREFDILMENLSDDHPPWHLSVTFDESPPVSLLAYEKFAPLRKYEGSALWERVTPAGPTSRLCVQATVKNLKIREDHWRDEQELIARGGGNEDDEEDEDGGGESESSLSVKSSGGDVGDDVADVSQGPELSDHGDGECHRGQKRQDCHEQ